MVRLSKVLGWICIAALAAAPFVVFGMFWYEQGFWAVADRLSKLNIVTLLLILVLFAPTMVALSLARRLEKRADAKRTPE